METAMISLGSDDSTSIKMGQWMLDVVQPRRFLGESHSPERNREVDEVSKAISRVFRPIEMVGDRIRIHGDAMIPQVTYEVSYKGVLIHFVKNDDGSIRLYEVVEK